MGFATHLGPWLLGTTKNTTGSTAATTRNTGCTVVSQSANVVFGTLTGNAIAVPAGSQIVDVILNVVTANDDTGTATVAVGTSGTANAFLPATSVKTAATTRGTLSNSAATDVGTTDIQVLADFTAQNGNGAAGSATVTVLYIQSNNLL